MSDVVVEMFGRLTGRDVHRGETDRGGRALRWILVGGGSGDEPADGGRGPLMVLESGLGEPLPTWAHVIGGLAAIGPVLAYERAGIGSSDPAIGPITCDGQVADLIAVIEDAGRGPCVAIGHSLGGFLIQVLAWQRPDLLAGTVLIDPSHEGITRYIPQEIVDAQAEQFSRLAAATVEAFIAENLEDWTEDAARISPDPRLRALAVDAWRASYPTQSQLKVICDEEDAAQREIQWAVDARAEGAFPKVPAVVLSATTGIPEDIRALFTSFHVEIAEGFGATHRSVPDAGHYIHGDNPQAVVDAARKVVEAVRRR